MHRSRHRGFGSVAAALGAIALALGVLSPSAGLAVRFATPSHTALIAPTAVPPRENFTPGWSNVSVGLGENEVPPARTLSAGAFYPMYSAWIVYGGKNASGTALTDTLLFVTGEGEWDILDEFWNGTRPSSPPALSGAALAYDAYDGYVLLFGGTLPNGTASNQTWTFSGGTWNELRWTQVATTGPTPPAASDDRMAYDSTDGYILLFSGNGSSSTWSYRSGVWSPVTTPLSPSTRQGPALIDDPDLGGVVLFGGGTGNPDSPALNDTWLYRDGNWSLLDTPTAPPPMMAPVGVYDAIDGYLLLVGSTITGYGPAGDETTWGLSGDRWGDLSATSGALPPARLGTVIAFDALDGTVLLYGGTDSGTGQVLGDMWAWNLPTNLVDSRIASFPVPPDILFVIGIAGVVPPVLAWAFFRRPPRRQPTDVPSPSPAPA